ncbi:MAG: spore coat protein CotJB [Clostridiales bacterium]|nr:MAG: spore coat protein CotJB [Clostridiales bacterium]
MQNGSDWDSMGRAELLRRIDEIGFAAYDLQLFLDTHRDCEEALELYKSLTFTYRAAVKAYEAKYGPLSAMNSSDKTPFEWVSDNLRWPWQKEGEM